MSTPLLTKAGETEAGDRIAPSDGGASSRLARWIRSAARSPLRLIVLAVLLVLIAYPVYWIFRAAIYDPQAGIHLSGLRDDWANASNLRALGRSVVYAASTASFATIVAVPLAFLFQMCQLRGKWLIPASAVVAYTIPSYLFAISYMLLLGPKTGLLSGWMINTIGWAPDLISFGGMIFLAVVHLWPLAFLIVSASLGQMDESLRDASRSVGASELRTTFRVVLPLIRPAILAGFILTYIYTLVLFSIPLIVGLPARLVVLTTAIYREYTSVFPDLPSASSLSVLFLLATIPAVILSRKATQRGRFTTGHSGTRRLVVLPRPVKVAAYAFIASVVVLAAALPLVHLLTLSVTKTWYQLTADMTFAHYASVFDDRVFLRTIGNSLLYGLGSAIGVTLLVALIAHILRQRLGQRTRGLFETLTIAPFAIPGVVLAVGYILAFGREPFSLLGTRLLLILAFTGHFIPVGYQAVQPAYQQLDPEWDDAARVCGAGLVRRLRTVMLPLLMPGLVVSATLVFISVAKELPLTLMLSSGRTLGVSALTIGMFEDGDFSRLGALGVLLIGFVLLASGIVRTAERRSTAKRLSEGLETP